MKPQLELTQRCESRSLDDLIPPNSATDSPLTHEPDAWPHPFAIPTVRRGDFKLVPGKHDLFEKSESIPERHSLQRDAWLLEWRVVRNISWVIL